jgi:riboflavin transporter FmnP
MAEIHPQLAPLYQRIHERNDIKSTRGSTRVVFVIAGFWMLCGVVNYLFFAMAFRAVQERATVAWAFWLLDVGRAGGWIDVVGVDVPVLVAAVVIGALPVLACMGLLTASGAERS